MIDVNKMGERDFCGNFKYSLRNFEHSLNDVYNSHSSSNRIWHKVLRKFVQRNRSISTGDPNLTRKLYSIAKIHSFSSYTEIKNICYFLFRFIRRFPILHRLSTNFLLLLDSVSADKCSLITGVLKSLQGL